MFGERAFEVTWDGLTLLANFSDASIELDAPPRGRQLWGALSGKRLDPWTASWWLAK
jgi:hypothetical protein